MEHNSQPVRIYVGASEKQLVPLRVLESSIRRRTKSPVEFYPIYQQVTQLPIPVDPENRAKTDFSFHRFLIPHLTHYNGKAIYLDSDMLVFEDIALLWNTSLHEYELLACPRPGGSPQFSVMLMDCGKLKWNIQDLVTRMDNGDLNYRKLMDFQFGVNVSVTLSEHWNSIDKYQEGKTCLLHYSKTTSQPWLFENHSLEALWLSEFHYALENGILNRAMVNEHVEKGWIKNSLHS